ncbi:MAG: hypothetical protein AAGA83_16315 [Cyanobacteria bacterium P01_F01_bin.116]
MAIVFGAGLWLTSMQSVAAHCRAELVERVDAIANRPELNQAHIGILVEQQGETAAEREVIVERNTNR